MPKRRENIKNKKYNRPLKTTLRIGTRKEGTSATSMTTKALLEVLGNPDKSKWHSNAATVLRNRGNLNQK